MLLITLLACYDFEGERGALGFVTDLYLDSGVKWTPEHAVVGGTAPSVAAVQRVGADEEEPPPEVWGDADFDEVRARGLELSFQGPEEGCGQVRYEGELEDHFSMCFEVPASIELFDPMAPEQALDTVAIANAASVHIRVLDEGGEPLGFRAEDLEAEGHSWLRGSELRLLRPGEVELRLAGVSTTLWVVDEEPVTFERVAVDEETDHVFAWTEQGVPVLGVEAR